MKPFHFKQFTVDQSNQVFRVGTDGVLLGVLVNVEFYKNILEVGTGTGLVSLMVAQRNPFAKILSLDINENAAKLAEKNFKNSPFNDRLLVELQDYKNFETSEKFDLIISNPPYFEENDSEKDILARQQTELTFENLIQKSAELLSQRGQLSVIIPFSSGEYFEKISEENGIYIWRRVKIFGIINSAPKRWLLEFGFEKKEVVEEEFTIEKSPRVYSDEYIELTKAFHQFST